MATVTARLYRDSLQTPWGFRVQGGSDFHSPLTVQRVFTGSPAEGELHRGDIIVAIENCDASSMLHREAQDLIRNSGGTLLLSVRKPHGSAGPARAPVAASGGGGGPHARGPSQPTWRPSGGPRPEFGVQYGSPRGHAGGRPAVEARPLPPSQQQRETAVDNNMMDRVGRSLAVIDLHAAAQRSMDDQDIDYTFMQQSVADRRRAFMQPIAGYGNTYNSVPRPSPAASSAAARYRQKRQPDPMLGQRLPDFGWAPSAEKLRQARGGWGPSHAGLEQQSYLPSQGQGREDSPFRTGGGRNGGHSGGGQSGRQPGGRGRQPGRQRSSATLRLNSTSGGNSGNDGGFGDVGGVGGGDGFGGGNEPPAELPVAFNKQYNTPINMYSKQNLANAFEGQTGISLGPGQTEREPAYTQSQVYKLVQEQDHQVKSRPRSQPQRQSQQPQSQGQHNWVRQQSDGDDFGVSEF